jgi:hypothetical protein
MPGFHDQDHMNYVLVNRISEIHGFFKRLMPGPGGREGLAASAA